MLVRPFLLKVKVMTQPIVGIVADERIIGLYTTYLVRAKYAESLIKFSKVTPVIIPPISEYNLINEYLEMIDGLLLTGSPSDIHPSRYGHEIKNFDSFFDKNRDETSLSMIQGAVERGMPVLGICRGFQEINVALGGTLHQSVHCIPNFLDHRDVESDDLEVLFGKRHSVKANPDGRLINMANQETWEVNSLHHQGIDLLAPVLQAEAIADDGLIEAISLKNDSKFVFGAQWHFEWQTALDQVSLAIFKAFSDACIVYKKSK
ncbi:MAG: gamma-glutamyl-gamma-aminobutyrate hydrolase family protein [Burkholderiales bacterium]|nr:gamma-glutamyl-gamma-aminobutyrate hydrolase family protein [Burkholderiales bacterium]